MELQIRKPRGFQKEVFMSYRGAGNFGRGYAICEFILEGNTLREATKEFRISETTARNDIYRVGLDAKAGYCKNPKSC